MALAKVRKLEAESGNVNDEASGEELSDEEAVESENNNTDNEDDADGNAGWADSIAKVLSSTKPKTKKTVVLSRAKKLQPGKETTVKEKPSYDFEVDGEIKEEKPDKEELKPNLKQRKNLHLPLRVRPTWKDIERERTLRKVATKGVVQLFNAVRMQQKDLQQQLEKAGPLDSRKDAVLNNINKKKFLDVLMSGNRAKSEAVDNTVKEEKEESSSGESGDDDEQTASDSGKKRKSQWSVLRPDFMTNKKIKHWDEEDEDNSDDNRGEGHEESEDDNDE